VADCASIGQGGVVRQTRAPRARRLTVWFPRRLRCRPRCARATPPRPDREWHEIHKAWFDKSLRLLCHPPNPRGVLARSTVRDGLPMLGLYIPAMECTMIRNRFAVFAAALTLAVGLSARPALAQTWTFEDFAQPPTSPLSQTKGGIAPERVSTLTLLTFLGGRTFENVVSQNLFSGSSVYAGVGISGLGISLTEGFASYSGSAFDGVVICPSGGGRLPCGQWDGRPSQCLRPASVGRRALPCGYAMAARGHLGRGAAAALGGFTAGCRGLSADRLDVGDPATHPAGRGPPAGYQRP
jgi:hypothetical protein